MIGVAASGVLLSAVFAQETVEPLPVFSAREVLGEELRAGPHHQVGDLVTSNGYVNQYQIDSEFGQFYAPSTMMLKVRIHEIGALYELEKVSKSEVFTKAAIEAGLSPAKAVVNFAKRPVATVTGIPKGISRMFKRISRTSKETTKAVGSQTGEQVDCDALEDDPQREDCEANKKGVSRARALHERYFRISAAERRWHEKLGTDPYTSNDVLYGAVKSVAWAENLGRFGIKFAGIPSIPGASYIATAYDIVWSKDPYELQDYNIKVLTDAGIDEETVEKFFANPWFSPSLQTTLISGIESLQGIPGRKYVLEAAALVTSEVEAHFLLESVIALTWYHHEMSEITEFVDEIPFPMAVSAEGKLIVILPTDHLVWTGDLAELAAAASGEGEDRGQERTRELWLFGGASERTKQEIGELRWIVREHQFATISATVTQATSSP